jgi:3-methylcrotonyl-CoA carboxylase alpha subunit
VHSPVFIANRGEIAVRIIGTLRRLGLASISVHGSDEAGALHVRLADVSVLLETDRPYLDIGGLIDAALQSGAEAVHPGYGFLAENPAFARACIGAGLVWIGPPPAAIELMGDKINAKRAVASAGVPVVPGRDEAGLNDRELANAAIDIGLPVLLKPSAGGGGKGMRLVEDEGSLSLSIAAARREAKAAFGDDTLLVERFIPRPRHIEVQIFADTHGNTVSLGERECSLQRRHQKIVEEAPSPFVDDGTRRAMFASAVAAARSCGYVGAGTVEFIVSADNPGEYFFMEMNTRLQVEHPVTEMVLGLDLVEWQLRVAAGEPLPWASPDAVLSPRGHAVEARVYAEDAARGFLPSTGRVLALRTPEGRPGLRVDSALTEGAEIGTGYDPMLAKVIAWAQHRDEAFSRLSAALASTEILGVTTNVGFLRRLLDDGDVRSGEFDTGLVERRASALGPQPTNDALVVAGMLEAQPPSGARGDPWSADGWRASGQAPIESRWRASDGALTVVSVAGDRVRVAAGPYRTASMTTTGPGHAIVTVGGQARSWIWARRGEELWLGQGGDVWRFVLDRETIDHTGGSRVGPGRIASPMPGTVLAVYVSEGEAVEAGRPLFTVEAMKMEHVITAPARGVVEEVLVAPGEAVALDQDLATITVDESDRSEP